MISRSWQYERAGPAEETGTQNGTDLLAAEAEDGAHAEAEIALLGLAEIGEVETGFHADADQFGNADIHRHRNQHGEFGLVETGIAGGGQLGGGSGVGLRIQFDLSKTPPSRSLPAICTLSVLMTRNCGPAR